jgi:hypothetical protein
VKRRALAVLPVLAAAAALAAGLEDAPRAAVLLAGLCAAAALAAPFSPEAPPAWLSAGAAFAAASAARLLGLWSADPALGFALTAAAGAAGAAAGAAGPAPESESRALAWAAAGGMLAAAEPSLVRFLGQNTADPARLFYATKGGELFLLGQPALLAAAAAAALARAARGLSRPAPGIGRFAGVAGALLATALCPRLDPSLALGAAGGALALAAAAGLRPWTPGALRALSARLAAAAAAAALAFAAVSPRALLQAWTARLDSLYPGGRYLALVDDGAAVWGAYAFSHGESALLRDGLIQRDDAAATLLALAAALGQKARTDCSVLLVRPTGPQTILTALRCPTAVEDGRPAEAAALDAEMGAGWRKPLAPLSGVFDAALVALPLPYGRSARRLTSAARLASLRARLSDGGAAAFVVPAFGASDAALESLRAAAATAFGSARAAYLPSGDGLVLACARAPLVDADALLKNLPARMVGSGADAATARKALALVRWLPAPSAK